MKRFYLFLIPTLALVAASCDRDEPGEVERVTTPQDVTVSRLARAAGAQLVPARVVAAEEAKLATRASGTVRSVHVDVGAQVRPGQVLLRLDAAGVESAVAAAEAGVTVARKTFQRLENLARDGAATDQEVDQARAQLEMAEANLAEARSNRDYVVLKAPFAGTVTARNVDPGDLAVPGQPMIIVSGTSGVKVVSDAPAPLADRIAIGDVVRILDPESGRHWPATVTRRVPVIERASNRFRVEAKFDDDATGTPLPTSISNSTVAVGAGVAMPTATTIAPGPCAMAGASAVVSACCAVASRASSAPTSCFRRRPSATWASRCSGVSLPLPAAWWALRSWLAWLSSVVRALTSRWAAIAPSRSTTAPRRRQLSRMSSSRSARHRGSSMAAQATARRRTARPERGVCAARRSTPRREPAK